MPLYTGQSDKHESLAILVFTDMMFIPAYRWKNIQAFTSNRSCIQLLTPTYSFHIKLTVKLIADKHFSSLSFMLYFYFAFQISLLQYHII